MISERRRIVASATFNRELACLKRMYNVARKGLIVLKGGIPVDKPAAAVSLEREHNSRDRVFTQLDIYMDTRPSAAETALP